MSDPAKFLAARLDELEAAANAVVVAAGEVTWYVRVTTLHDMDRYEHAQDVPRTALARRFDPARVLREVEAGRKILAEYERLDSAYRAFRHGANQAAFLAIEIAVRNLAAVDSDHPDYDPAWAAE